MEVRVRISVPLTEIFGISKDTTSQVIEITLRSEASLRDLFLQLSAQYPAFGSLVNTKHSDLLESIMIIIDGKLLPEPKQLDTKLKEVTEISLLPHYAGG